MTKNTEYRTLDTTDKRLQRGTHYVAFEGVES